MYFNDTSSSSEDSDDEKENERKTGCGNEDGGGGGGGSGSAVAAAATAGGGSSSGESLRRLQYAHCSSAPTTAGGSGSSGSSQMHHGSMAQMSIIDIPMPPPLKINNGSGLGSGEESPSVIPGCPQQHAQPRHGQLLPLPSSQHHRRDSAWKLCSKAAKKRRNKLRLRKQLELENVNSVSKVDKFARIAFPLSFLCINVFYWYSYLYKGSSES